MAESVYRNETQKFDLIVTTLKDIHDLNAQLARRDGFGDYTHLIGCAHRTCGLGIEFWSSIHMNSLRACVLWDALNVSPTQFQPLWLKLAALSVMLNNFSDSPSADDTRYWKLENDKLLILDKGENPPSTEPPALRDNPPHHHPRHQGPRPGDNPASPRHAQLIHMLERVQHSMR
jgi:hypothetical protein